MQWQVHFVELDSALQSQWLRSSRLTSLHTSRERESTPSQHRLPSLPPTDSPSQNRPQKLLLQIQLPLLVGLPPLWQLIDSQVLPRKLV
jgi:hypothetical protein